MNLDMATQIWCQIRSTQWGDLRDDLVEVAVRYARIRVDWLLADAEQRMQIEPDRTATHNAFIAACDILARNMSTVSESTLWRRTLGDDRKEIGDFACYIHCMLGLNGR